MIPWAKPVFWGRERQYVLDALESTWISGGKYVDQLEEELADLFGCIYALATSNGTAALHLAYLGLGIQPGDEIIIPGFGFMAAANIALHIGAIPVFVEVDKDNWCLDNVEAAITPKTKAIVAIHTFGNLCSIISNKYDIPLIEDCAESIFSTYKSKYCGSFGKISTFSFHATKMLTTGEGGMVMTNDAELFYKMSLYRSHGLSKRGRYDHIVPGHNFRLTNLQAAIGCAQLEKKDTIIEKKREIDRLYKYYLPGAKFQAITKHVDPVMWVTAIQVKDRDALIDELKTCGIETRPGFTASSMLSIYKEHHLPICEYLANTIISLPSYPSITPDKIRFICQRVMELGGVE